VSTGPLITYGDLYLYIPLCTMIAMLARSFICHRGNNK
jgi:hypothetical protein